MDNMLYRKVLRRAWIIIATLTGITFVAVSLFFPKAGGPSGTTAMLQAVSLQPAGGPRLISIQPFSEMKGAICEWMPASATSTTSLTAALWQEPASAGAAQTSPNDVMPASDIERAPVRVIRDTYSTYSAIAVDTNSNEVYLQDENLFGFKVFNRMDDTPPNAQFTEPKRVVSGPRTKMEFNCGLYIDPKTGDVYSVNNDTMDTLVVFPREARGNVAPKRALRTPHGTYGIAVDEEAQELFLTVEHVNSVVVFRKMAEGEEKPIRTLQGDQTELEDPHGIAVDGKNNWVFVTNHGNVKNTNPPQIGRFEPPSITVHSLQASGDTPPLRVIEGPKTQLNWPAALYVDPERGELYVANDAGNSILVFRTTDSGDVAPTRIVKGPRTGIRNPTGVFVDLRNNELWVSNMGNHRAVVFPRTADGDVAPLRTIRSAPEEKIALAIGNPGGVAYDNMREEILVPN